MPRWTEVPNRRDGILQSVELAGEKQQALVEQVDDVDRIIVSLSLMLKPGATMDDGKEVAEQMLVTARL